MRARCPNCGSLVVSRKIVYKQDNELVDPIEYANELISSWSSLTYPYPYPYHNKTIVQIVVQCQACKYTEVYSPDDLQ